MHLRSLVPARAALLCAALALAQPSGAQVPPDRRDPAPTIGPVPTPRKAPVYVGGVLDIGQFLPDTAVLARVNDRVIRVARFVDAYFASYAPVRPRPDSLGRVEFLNSMINKEVLALTALGINRPLTFEDRTVLRGHTDRVLANVLFQRAVLDSVTVSEEDIQRLHAQYRREQRYQHIMFEDPNTAAAVRRDLIAGRITWRDAVRRYSTAKNLNSPDGDMGRLSRGGMNMQMALQVWDLEPGRISPVVADADGFHLMKLVERRTVEPPSLGPMQRLLQVQLREYRASERAGRLQAQVGAHIGLVYDTTNILWASARFQNREPVRQAEGALVLDLSGEVPEFQPADTARVLARHKEGRFTLGDFLHAYQERPPAMRQPVGDFESFRAQLDAMMLEPYMAHEARLRGLERDPLAASQIESKREELLVDHLFQDSIQSRVWIPPAERRRYYDEHIAQFTTYPKARFAAIVRDSKEAADSLLARLRAGEKAEDILRADSLRGVTSGSIQERADEGRGGQHHNIIFGELRPGQASVTGPDREGTWLVIQLLEFDPGRQLPYEEVQHYVDESLQNIKAEAMLLDLIARHRKRYRIESRSELVMRVRLVDPTLE